MGKMLSIEEVAERYQVDRATLWRWRKDGKFLEPIKTPDGLRWDSERLDVWDKVNEKTKELMAKDDAEWKALLKSPDSVWTGDRDLILILLKDFFGLPDDASDAELLGRTSTFLDKFAGVQNLFKHKKKGI